MAGFPVHPDGITADWLTRILGARVDHVRWEPIGTGQVGDSVRLHLEGADIPSTLAAKFPAADAASRGTATMFGLYRKEVEFYRRVASLLDVRAPIAHFADVSDDGAEFCLLFEDLGPARQGDQIAGCGLADAREAIKQAAAIHAPSWGRKEILEAGWVQPPENLGATVSGLYPQAQAIFQDRYRDTLEPDFMALCEGLAELSARYFIRDGKPECLVHGDFRLDNMLFDVRGGEEPIAVLDWQTVTIGHPMNDVGYFLGCGIGQLGLDHEIPLLDLYYAEMAARGITLAHEDLQREYRLGILHGVSTAVFSAAFVERTPRGDENFLSMARGACALALRHECLQALEES